MSRMTVRTRNGDFPAELDDSDISNAIWLSLPLSMDINMLGGMIVMDLLYSALGNAAIGFPSVLGLYFNVFFILSIIDTNTYDAPIPCCCAEILRKLGVNILAHGFVINRPCFLRMKVRIVKKHVGLGKGVIYSYLLIGYINGISNLYSSELGSCIG